MPIPIVLPKFSEQIDESEIVQWLKQEGERVRKGDPVCEVTTDKVDMEVEAPADGTLYAIQYPVGASAPVTGVIAYLLREGEAPPAEWPTTRPRSQPEAALAAPQIPSSNAQAEAPGPAKESESSAASNSKVRATPAARRAAHKSGVRLEGLQGSGPRGRIQKADVEAAIAVSERHPAGAPGPAASQAVQLSGKRRTIARRMQASFQTAPHIFVEMQVDVTRIDNLRARLKARNERVSITAIVVKACAAALRRFPAFNATIDGETVTLWSEVDIGVAVAAADGLTAPVLRAVDECPLKQVQAALDDVASRARGEALNLDDLTGATFSVSNLGMYGISRFTAILNPPQVAILAVGQASRQFVPDENDQPVARSIMTLVLSVDHRWLDGAQAAEFLGHLKLLLEEPALLAW